MASFDPQPPHQPSYELVVYQLGELRAVTEGGFAKIDGRIESVQGQVTDLRDRVTVVETKQASGFTLPGSDIVKLIGLIVAVLLAAAGGDATGVLG